MIQDELAGTGVALITPFHEDLTIQFADFKKLLIFLAENGVDYYVVNGTTGESATTDKEEKHKLLDFIRNNNPSGLPIVYGTGGYDTKDIVEHVKELDWTGVNSLLSVSPYYNRPTQKGIVQHYLAIADACPVPVIMYNVPKRTGVNMTAATTLELAKHENIVGIKEASGDMAQIIDILSGKPDDFMLISGDDMCTVPMISMGAIGVISVLANAKPREMSDMVNYALKGNFEAAQRILFNLSAMNPLMYEESSPVGVKQLLEELGLCKNYVRLPLLAASEELAMKIRKML